MRRRTAVAAVVLCGFAVVAPAPGAAAPRPPLATYTRIISAKALANTGLPQAYGRWFLTFRKDRTLFVQGPAGFSAYQQVTVTSAGRFTVREDFCSPKSGTYAWKLAGRTLTRRA
jgi:hypothetical protein